MGRKKRGETPVFSYRMRLTTAEKLNKIYKAIADDWDAVFNKLALLWDENSDKSKHNCNTEIITVIQKSEAKKVMDIFYQINKTLDFKKPFEFQAAEYLINTFGIEDTLKWAQIACKTLGMPYAPRITKPTELKDKWANLQAFAMSKIKEEQSKPKGLVI